MTAISVSTRKRNLLTWIESLQDKNLLKKLENVKEEAEKKSESYLLPGKPMSVNELKKRALDAHEAVVSGEFITHEDLKKEMNTW